MRRLVTLLLVGAAVVSACSDDSSTADTAADTTAAPETTLATETTTADTAAPDTTTADTDNGGSVAPPDPARPFEVFTPSSYDPATPTPLVILLHGFGASGDLQEAFFQVQPLAEERGFLYVHPDGTVNQIGSQFWNATDACCGFQSDVDDVAYLTAIIDQVSAEKNVDPNRIFLMGHSNGGFMSYRMACDVADRVAAIASLAGATFADEDDCSPSEPVSVLQVHGTADETIAYEGGSTPIINGTYPSAAQTTATWAGYNGCAVEPAATGTTLDLIATLDGAETSVQAFGDCPEGVAVELWSIDGGPHVPPLNFPDNSRPMTELMLDFLFAHPKG
jgi:polyhydroxybutyrate depolymerase